MKKLILGLVLSASLISPIQALTGAGSIGFQFPYGTTVSYEHNLNGKGAGVYFSTLSGDLDSTSLELTSYGVSYTFYTKDILQGWYYGPGIAYRQFTLDQTVLTIETKAKADLIDVHANLGYSWLVSDRVNIKLGGSVGYMIGDLEVSDGNEASLSYNPEGMSYSIQTSVGYAF